MYAFLLILHSNLRWLILSAALGLLVLRALPAGPRQRCAVATERLHRTLIGSLHLQVLAGVVLYVAFSPFTTPFIDGLKGSLRDRSLRFYGMEHPVSMVVALALFQLGRFKYRRAAGAASIAGWVFTGLGLGVLLIAVPWPWLAHGRPWARTSIERNVPDAAPRFAPCPPVYFSTCAPCHGEHGRGNGLAAPYLRPKPRDFAASGWVSSRSDEELARVIGSGGPALGLSAVMPANPNVQPDEMRQLVACIRGLSTAAP
jgi:hypothetical protein